MLKLALFAVPLALAACGSPAALREKPVRAEHSLPAPYQQAADCILDEMTLSMSGSYDYVTTARPDQDAVYIRARQIGALGSPTNFWRYEVAVREAGTGSQVELRTIPRPFGSDGSTELAAAVTACSG